MLLDAHLLKMKLVPKQSIIVTRVNLTPTLCSEDPRLLNVPNPAPRITWLTTMEQICACSANLAAVVVPTTQLSVNHVSQASCSLLIRSVFSSVTTMATFMSQIWLLLRLFARSVLTAANAVLTNSDLVVLNTMSQEQPKLLFPLFFSSSPFSHLQLRYSGEPCLPVLQEWLLTTSINYRKTISSMISIN